jgi:hypothetical protein
MRKIAGADEMPCKHAEDGYLFRRDATGEEIWVREVVADEDTGERMVVFSVRDAPCSPTYSRAFSKKYDKFLTEFTFDGVLGYKQAPY